MNKQMIKKTVLIPVNEIVRIKGSDMRIIALCNSMDSNDIIIKDTSISKCYSMEELNSKLDEMSSLLGMSRNKLMKEIYRHEKIGSDEFKESPKKDSDIASCCIEINCIYGKFIKIEYDVLKRLLLDNISKNAFKLYIILLFLYTQKKNPNIDIEISREELLKAMGLSEVSTQVIKKAEDELIGLNLITINTKYERRFYGSFNVACTCKYRYYNILTT